MGFTAVRVAQRVTGGSGVSASCTAGDTPANRTVRISLTRDAQKRYFGRHIDQNADRFDVQRGTDTDKGKVRITLDPEGEVQIRKSVQDSVNFRVQSFPPIPPGKVKATPCTVVDAESDKAQGILTIRLPWRDGSAG